MTGNYLIFENKYMTIKTKKYIVIGIAQRMAPV